MDKFMKPCSKRHIVFPLSSFGPKHDRKSGIASQCRACEQQRISKWARENKGKRTVSSRKWRAKDPAKWKRYEVARGLSRHYGLSVAQYEELERNQAGVCAICMKPQMTKRRLVVDHDHLTGKIRGLLCDGCNPGIGYFHDDPELLRLAAGYLLKNTPLVEIEL